MFGNIATAKIILYFSKNMQKQYFSLIKFTAVLGKQQTHIINLQNTVRVLRNILEQVEDNFV